MRWSEFWTDAGIRIKESITWLSVQVTAAWGVVWIVYSQLPATTIVELANVHFLSLSVVAWMGIMQTVTTYIARVKPPKQVP